MNLLQDLLTELHSESLEDAASRAAGEFDRIAGACADRLVIFGTGYVGRLALEGLRAAGVEPLAFCDNNPRTWGTRVDEVPVLSPAGAAERYRDSAAFIIAIYNPSGPWEQLRQLGCERIVPYPVLFWKYRQFMPREDRLELPAGILARSAEFAAGYDLLADEKSRREFRAQIRWRCLLDYACLPKPDPAVEMYYPPELMRLLPEEVLVDCGAFDGDSIREFLRASGGRFGHIYALEADPGNAAALRQYQGTLEPAIAGRITLMPVAVGSHDGTLQFAAEGFVGSRVVNSGSDSKAVNSAVADSPAVEVECRRLDSLLAGAAPTFIKMDIEGAELDALAGAPQTMARHRPVMAICAYHKCDHLWIIPQLLQAGSPDYRIFLRRYAEDCWETVYYAVPPERVLDTTAASLSPIMEL